MIYQNEAPEVALHLDNEGILPSDVTISLYKQGAVDYVPKILTETNFKDLGDGIYVLLLDASDTDVEGLLLINIQSGYGSDFIEERVVVRSAFELVPPSICRIFGNVRDIGAVPDMDVEISSRPARVPLDVYGGSIITTKTRQTRPDAAGNFYLDLIQNSTVVIDLQGTGIRLQITVPEQANANLIDLIP